jgi:hypothetical protein
VRTVKYIEYPLWGNETVSSGGDYCKKHVTEESVQNISCYYITKYPVELMLGGVPAVDSGLVAALVIVVMMFLSGVCSLLVKS